MKWLPTILFFFFVGVVSNSFSQSLGDFRSFQDGNWSDSDSWEYFDGASWISPPTNTYYPGDGNLTTNNVYIVDNHTILLNTDVNNLINSIIIGDQNGTETSISTLLVGVNGNNTYSLNTNQISILYDGLMKWNGNNTLVLPTGTSISIEQISPYNPTTQLGTHYGLYEAGDCSTPMEIIIGGTLYSNCNGEGKPPKPPSFEDVNNGGGNLSVSPTSNSPVCSGQPVNLFANSGGTESGSAIFNWTVISSPVAYSFTSTSKNPIDDAPAPTTIGTYVYEVTASSGTAPNIITNTNTVSVEIISCNKTVITNRRITYRVKK